MALFDQQKTTYSDTAAQVRVISNIIQLIDPVDTPLIAALGGLDAARSKFRIGMNGTKIELLEDSYNPVETTVNNGTVALTTNTTNFTVADASIFQDGHVILIDNELMVVSSADAANDTIAVYSRSYGGTNATHDATSAISIVGMARLEGDDADYVGLQALTNPYNYSSIYQKALKVSGTEEVVDQYGFDNAFSYQAQKAVPELLRLVERNIFWGVRAAGSASAPRSAGGLGTFITDNSVNAGGAIAKTDFDNLAELVMIDGGNPDLLVMHPSIANDVKALLDSSSFVRVDQNPGGQFGMSPITRVDTQYGSLRMVISRWCPTAKAYMLDSRKVGLYTLRPFGWKPLAVTGDSRKGEVVGEFSLMVANDKAHGWVYGITT